MRAFEAGGVRFHILSHQRVRGENFPTPSPGYIAEEFVVECFDAASGSPIDLQPNDKRSHGHREVVRWVGLEAQPVFALVSGTPDDGTGVYAQVGTKRGADFRTRFWPTLMRRVTKAQLAASLGKRIGAVTEFEISAADATIRARLRGDFIRPVALSRGSLDDAVRSLTGDEPKTGMRLQRGTTTNIDCDYNADTTNSGPITSNGTAVRIGNFGGFRTVWRFPLGAVDAGDSITDSDWQGNVSAVGSVDAGEGITLHPYNSDGQEQPSDDSASDMNSRCAAGSAFGNIDCSATGSKTLDLGTTADGLIEAAKDAVDRFSIGSNRWNQSGSEQTSIEAIDAAGTDPATLTLVHAPAGITATPATLALVIATFAPSIKLHKIATPATKALSISSFAPTVVAPRLVTPTTKALTITPFAPAVSRAVVPPTMALTTQGYAPTVVAPRVVTPSTLALLLEAFAPVVRLTVVPGTKALSLTAFAPTVLAPRLATPPTAELVTEGFAPSITVGARATPTTLAMTITAYAPAVATPRTVTPSTLALLLATFAPSLGQGVAPPTKALLLQAFAPVVSAPRVVTPGAAALGLTLLTPTVTTPRRVTPALVALTLVSFAPSVLAGQTFAPATLALVLTTYAPQTAVLLVVGVIAFLRAIDHAALAASGRDNSTLAADGLDAALLGRRGLDEALLHRDGADHATLTRRGRG